MSTKIRLTRAGAKKRPFYRIVVADSKAPRDGRFIERVGVYNPILPKTHPERVVLKKERVEEWLSKGAIPTEVVIRFIQAQGITLPANLQKRVEVKLKSRKPKAPKKQEAAS